MGSVPAILGACVHAGVFRLYAEVHKKARGISAMSKAIKQRWGCKSCKHYHMIDSGYGDCVRYPPRLVLMRWFPHVLYDTLYPHVGWDELTCGEFQGRRVSSDGL